MPIQVESAEGVRIKSEPVVFPSRNGHKMVGFLDVAEDCPEDAAFVVVTPKFGESKKNSLQFAYQLAANGLRVLRFDHTCHVGESTGGIRDYTFSGAITDILSALDFVQLQYAVARVQLVANSLSARCALGSRHWIRRFTARHDGGGVQLSTYRKCRLPARYGH